MEGILFLRGVHVHWRTWCKQQQLSLFCTCCNVTLSLYNRLVMVCLESFMLKIRVFAVFI